MKTRGTRIAYSFYQILGVDWPEGFLLAPTKYCCSLLKRMQLTCKAWVESVDTPGDGRDEIYIHILSRTSLSLHDFLSTDHNLLGTAFMTSLKSNACAVLTT